MRSTPAVMSVMVSTLVAAFSALIDPAEMLDNRKKWDELWTTTVLKPK